MPERTWPLTTTPRTSPGVEGREYAVEGTSWIDRQYGSGDGDLVMANRIQWTLFSVEFEECDDVISAWLYVNLDRGTTQRASCYALSHALQ